MLHEHLYKEYHTNFYAKRIQNNEPLKVVITFFYGYLGTFIGTCL